MPDSSAQYSPYGTRKARGFVRRKSKASSRWIYAGVKQRFAHIDISKARHFTLIEEKGFDFRSTLLKLCPKPLAAETGTQGILAQRAYLRNLTETQYFIGGEQTKSSMIPVFQFRKIGKPEDSVRMFTHYVCMFGIHALLLAVENFAAHSQMYQPKSLRLQLHNDVFPTAQNFTNGSAAKSGRECAVDRPAQRQAGKANLSNALIRKHLAELSRQRFNFRHLGHF